MRKQISIKTITDQLKYYPTTGMFEWAVRGKGRALGMFAGTPVSKTYHDIFDKVYDPRTGEFLGHANPHDVVKHLGYVIRIDGETYPAHTLAYAIQTGKWMRVSHINGDKYDNRWNNLTTDRDKARHYAQHNPIQQNTKEQEMTAAKAFKESTEVERRKSIVESLWDQYKYDPETGTFLRLRSRYEQWERGTPIKSNNSRTLFFSLPDGTRTSCPCHIAAYILMTGVYPEQTVIHVNKRKDDNRWSNLGLSKQQVRGY